jgi:hypothetical protein
MDRVHGLFVLGLALGACTLDVGRLQAPASQHGDAAADLPTTADMAAEEDATADTLTGSGEDGSAGPVDLSGIDAVASLLDAGVPRPSDAAKDMPLFTDAADVFDLPLPKDAATDAPANLDERGADGPGDDGGVLFDADGSGGAGGGGAGGSGGAGGEGGAGGTAASGGAGGTSTDTGGAGGAILDPDAGPDVEGQGGTGGLEQGLVLWYRFDESSGSVASDSSPVGGHDGTVGTAGTGGSATFTTDSRVGTHALTLTPSSYSSSAGGYVTVPAPGGLTQDAATIAIWVKPASASSSQNWARIYDFGSGTTARSFFYLTSRASDATNTPIRFGISNSGHTAAAEQRLEGTTMLSAKEWHHIVVVLPAGATYTGTLYIDGVAVATNAAMSVHLSDIGATTMNWLGRSPFTSDPYFSGSLDDFRIYSRALSAEEVAALYAYR